MSLNKGLFVSSVVTVLAIGLITSLSMAQRPPVGGSSSTSNDPSAAQGGGRPAPIVHNDWHLLQFGSSVIRYNSMNGTTQSLSLDNSGKATWRNFSEHSGGTVNGNVGRFQVIVGQSPIGGIVRVDTQSGETWGINKPAGISASDLTPGGIKASDLTPGNFGYYKHTNN
jgi:hypothetical protein